MADHTTYSLDPMERLTNAAPPTYSQVVENAPPPYQPTSAVILPEVKNLPIAPQTSAPVPVVIPVNRIPLTNEQREDSGISTVGLLVFLMAFIMSLIGTPLVLFAFLPSIYCICKVHKAYTNSNGATHFS